MLYFSDRLGVFDVLVFIFSHSILVGLHEYVYSRAEKRKVLEEIQQTKSHDLVRTYAQIQCSTNTRGHSELFEGNRHFPKFVT